MKFRLIKRIVAAFAGLTLLLTAPVSAQNYSGPAATDGVFSADGVVVADSDVSFEATGLLPGAAVSAVLIASDGSSSALNAAEVQGAVATRLAGGTVGADGTINLVITMPSDLASGTYTIEVRSTSADGSPFISRSSFNVGGTLSGPNALAFTGAETSNFVQIALMLMLLGLGAVVVGARRQRKAEGTN